MESVFVDSVDICILDFLADLSIHRRFSSQYLKTGLFLLSQASKYRKKNFNILLRAEKEE